MTEAAAQIPAPAKAPTDAQRRLKRRYAAERRFQLYGLLAVGIAAAALAALVVSISLTAVQAFWVYKITLEIDLDRQTIDPRGALAKVEADETLDDAARAAAVEAVLRRADYGAAARRALETRFPDVQDRTARRELAGLISQNVGLKILDSVLADPSLIGGRLKLEIPISDDVDVFLKLDAERERRPGLGDAAPSDVTGAVEISSQRNEFAPIIDAYRVSLRDDIADLERVAASADRAALEAKAKAEAAPDDEEAARAAVRAQGEADGAARRLQDTIAKAQATTLSQTLSSDMPSLLIHINGGVVKAESLSASTIKGQVLLPLASTETARAGAWEVEEVALAEADRRVSDRQLVWVDALIADKAVRPAFNDLFFTAAASREPEFAGIRGAFVGTLLTMLVTMLLALPLGVSAAVYLEEFAPKNRFTDLIEVNINNLAAVPSIVFGLLGLAVFIGFFGLPRSAPLVGGLVLSLMTLPTVIIATRSALKAVPPSIRAGALAVGASPVQAVWHHVLPLATPGIMTGSIIGLARAMGETAPLLMIGMVAFVADVPGSVTDSATVMPVQIYQWADSAERAFVSRTSAAIAVLLLMMIALNLIAVLVRRRFERRW